MRGQKLGIGGHTTPENASDIARILFLDALQHYAPNVLDDLQKLVGMKEFEPELVSWAKRWHLLQEDGPALWIMDEARRAIVKAEKKGFDTVEFLFRTMARTMFEPVLSLEEQRIELFYNPEVADRPWMHDKLNSAMDRIEKLVAGLATERWRNPEHLKWAILYQVLGKRFKEVADLEGKQSGGRVVGEDTIRKAVDKVLAVVGLTRRNAKA